MRRTQIYLDDEQTELLDERAAAQGVTRSTLIRSAVQEYLLRDDADPAAWRTRWRQAVTNTAGAAAHLPDGAEFVQQLRESDARRLGRLAG